MAAAGPPPGYERITMPGLVAVARPSCAAALRDVLRAESLYAHAARHPERRQHVGRAPAYAIPLGPELRVVVRHSRHGGLLAPLTGDRFLAPTRAPHELRTALRLADAGVPTPEVMATVVYHAAPLLRTADVATREVAGARDLSAALADPSQAARDAAVAATARLLAALAAAGARHPDLNLKNVLLAPAGDGAVVAHVLDVDRVRFEAPGSAGVAAANARRLAESVFAHDTIPFAGSAVHA